MDKSLEKQTIKIDSEERRECKDNPITVLKIISKA